MLNTATSSAITANPVSALRRKPRNPLLISLMFSLARSVPVMACTPVGSRGCSSPISRCADTPGAALIRISVTLLGSSVT